MRYTMFNESDAGKWKQNPINIPFTPFEEYKEKLKDCISLRRENGILEAKLHDNGDSMIWGGPHHKAIHQFCTWAGADPENEVIIFGGAGDEFTASLLQDSEDDKKVKPHMETEDNFWMLYEHSYFDGANDNEGLIFDLEVPTIGVLNGPGFHTELVMFTDITLCADHAWTTDMHFRTNIVPGDGIQIAWRELMGRKRFAYAELTGQILTPKMMLEYGMVNEVHPLDKVWDRAWEIAELIMLSSSRVTRRMTTQILRAPWKMDLAWENRHAFGSEVFTTATESPPHDGVMWRSAQVEAKHVFENEEKGLLTYPKLGPVPGFEKKYEFNKKK